MDKKIIKITEGQFIRLVENIINKQDNYSPFNDPKAKALFNYLFFYYDEFYEREYKNPHFKFNRDEEFSLSGIELAPNSWWADSLRPTPYKVGNMLFFIGTDNEYKTFKLRDPFSINKPNKKIGKYNIVHIGYA